MHLGFWIHDNYDFNSFRDKTTLWPHYGALNTVIRMLRGMGWRIIPCPETKARYPILSKWHKYGECGDLKASIEIFPAGFRFEFYHEFNVTHSSGGKYEFHKWERAPYLLRLQFIKTANAIIKKLQAVMPCRIDEVDNELRGAAFIVKQFQSHSFAPKNQITDVTQIPSFMSSYDLTQNNNDRDKKKIVCGDTKYYRSERTGRLVRGQAWHNINNMWWVILPSGEVRNEASWRLFDPTPADFAQRRVMPAKIPKGRQEQLSSLSSLPTYDLKRELKRRRAATA